VAPDIDTALIWNQLLQVGSSSLNVDDDAITYVSTAGPRSDHTSTHMSAVEFQELLSSTASSSAHAGEPEHRQTTAHGASSDGYVYISQAAVAAGQMFVDKTQWFTFITIALCLKSMLENGHGACVIVLSAHIPSHDRNPCTLMQAWTDAITQATTMIKPTRASPPRALHIPGTDSFVLHIYDTLSAFATMQRWAERQFRGSVTSVSSTLPSGTVACDVLSLLRMAWPSLVCEATVISNQDCDEAIYSHLTSPPVLSIILDLRGSFGSFDKVIQALATYYRQFTQPNNDELSRFQVLILTSQHSRQVLSRSLEWIQMQYGSEPGFMRVVNTDNPRWVSSIWTPFVMCHLREVNNAAERWSKQLFQFLNNSSALVIKGDSESDVAAAHTNPTHASDMFSRTAFHDAVQTVGADTAITDDTSAQKLFEAVMG
jgi:hypothetical protein